MIAIDSIINTDRWRAALIAADLQRPHIRSLGDGEYRIVKRASQKEAGWRPHIVQFAMAGDRVYASCDCDAFRWRECCIHIARAYQHCVRRAEKRAA